MVDGEPECDDEYNQELESQPEPLRKDTENT